MSGEHGPSVESIRLAVQTLGMSREMAAEIQGYIKRLLDEEQADRRKCPVELLTLERYHRDWKAWGKRAP